MDIQFLDDVRQVGGMEEGQAVLGDLQAQEVRGGEGLHEPPGNKVVSQVVIEEPLKKLVRRLLQAHPAHEPPEAHVHMDQKEAAVHFQQMEVIHPQNLGPVGIDNLLVQEGFL